MSKIKIQGKVFIYQSFHVQELKDSIVNLLSKRPELNSFNRRTDIDAQYDWISGKLSESMINNFLVSNGSKTIPDKEVDKYLDIVVMKEDKEITIEVKSSLPRKPFEKVDETIVNDMSLFTRFTTRYRPENQKGNIKAQVLVYGVEKYKKSQIKLSDFLNSEAELTFVLAGYFINDGREYNFNGSNIKKTKGSASYNDAIKLINTSSSEEVLEYIKGD